MAPTRPQRRGTKSYRRGGRHVPAVPGRASALHRDARPRRLRRPTSPTAACTSYARRRRVASASGCGPLDHPRPRPPWSSLLLTGWCAEPVHPSPPGRGGRPVVRELREEGRLSAPRCWPLRAWARSWIRRRRPATPPATGAERLAGGAPAHTTSRSRYHPALKPGCDSGQELPKPTLREASGLGVARPRRRQAPGFEEADDPIDVVDRARPRAAVASRARPTVAPRAGRERATGPEAASARPARRRQARGSRRTTCARSRSSPRGGACR